MKHIWHATWLDRWDIPVEMRCTLHGEYRWCKSMQEPEWHPGPLPGLSDEDRKACPPAFDFEEVEE